MDVDQPVFTQVRRAYTEADKKRLQEQVLRLYLILVPHAYLY
jgi:hypothetical protein